MPDKPGSAFKQVTAVLVLVALVTCSAAFYIANLTYDHDVEVRIREINDANSSVASIVEENLRLVLSQSDYILRLMEADVERNGFIESVHISFLQDLLRTPTINQIAVADKEGNLVFSAVPLKEPLNIGSREHFQAQIPADTNRLYIATPWMSITTGMPTIFLSRRVNDSEGNFAGIVLVGIKQDYLETVLSDLGLLGEGHSIVMLRRDGAFLSRVPGAAAYDKMKDAYRSHDAFGLIDQGLTAGFYESRSKSEGKQILGSFRAMADYPLVILAGFEKDKALGSTMQRKQTYFFMAGLSSLLLLIMLFIIWWQILQQYKIAVALAEEQSLLHTTLSALEEGVIATDETAKIRLMNKPAEYITDWTEADAIGLDVSAVLQLIDTVTGNSSDLPISAVLKTKGIAHLFDSTILLTRQGQQRPITVSLAPIVSPSGETTGVVIIFRDLTEIKKMEDQSNRDQMTGLYNRRFFEEELKQAVSEESLPLCLIMADVNNLKTVNDTLGHQTGDELIVKTAQVIQSVLRHGDTVARIGGDEFAILLPNTSEEAAEKVIKRMMEQCAQTIVGGQPLSSSFGCVEMKSVDQNIGDVMAEADARMYEAKRRLKGQER